MNSKYGWLIVVIYVATIMGVLIAQERTSEPLRIWEIARKDFSDEGSTRTIFVYKFQVGKEMRCKAVFALLINAPVSLGDVPCE